MVIFGAVIVDGVVSSYLSRLPFLLESYFLNVSSRKSLSAKHLRIDGQDTKNTFDYPNTLLVNKTIYCGITGSVNLCSPLCSAIYE